MSFAAFISYLTEPMIIATATVLLGGFHAGVTGTSWNIFAATVAGCSLVIWVLRVVAVKRLKTNWDISDRKKRVHSLIPLIGICLFFLLLLFRLHNPGLTRFGATLFFWLIGFFLITLRTKISGHMAVLTLFAGLILSWYGLRYLPLILVLPVVAWSRLVLKRHTMVEVIGGTLYSAGILLLVALV